MLDTIKHAFPQRRHFLCALIKTLLLCKPTLGDYYFNPEVALAFYLGKDTPKIFLLHIVKIKVRLTEPTELTKN